MPLAWWVLSAVLSRLAPLLPPAQIWFYLAPLAAGAVPMIAILLLTAHAYWSDLRLNRAWRRWRIDRNGLSILSQAGGWASIRFGPGDRVGDGAIIGGTQVPVGLFSGGQLTSKLLIGLGQRQGAAVGPDGDLRNTALRCLLLWCPLLTAGWLAYFHLTGNPVHIVHWAILGIGWVSFGWVGAVFLWFHFKLRRHLRRLAVEAEHLLKELGW